MNKKFLLITIIFILNYCIGVFSENAYYIVGILRNDSDDNYDEADQNIKNEIDKLVNDRMNDIYEVIENNKDSYILDNGEMDKKLEELNSSQLKKRNNRNQRLLFKNDIRPTDRFINNNNSKRSFSSVSENDNIEYISFESNLVSHICPIFNYYTINAYLSDFTSNIVCIFNNVIYCKKASHFKLLKSNKKKNPLSKPKDKNYYNLKAIKKETNWTDVSVQSFNYPGYPNYLSLISQGNQMQKDKPFDENFYYPSTAGQGIDIYFIDEGIMTNHDDFNTYKGTPYERTITCDAISQDNKISISKSEDEKNTCWVRDSLIPNYPRHGISVSSSAGGTLFGVAKKANLHMIATEIVEYNVLRSLDYILVNAKPHKSVVSLSIGQKGYFKLFDNKLNDMVKKGLIIIVAAGNEGENFCVSKEDQLFNSFISYDSIISVGAVDSTIKNGKYYASDYSNFGKCVDIFAPGEVLIPVVNTNNSTDFDIISGTSFAAPLVAGVAASIMSEPFRN